MTPINTFIDNNQHQTTPILTIPGNLGNRGIRGIRGIEEFGESGESWELRRIQVNPENLGNQGGIFAYPSCLPACCHVPRRRCRRLEPAQRQGEVKLVKPVALTVPTATTVPASAPGALCTTRWLPWFATKMPPSEPAQRPRRHQAGEARRPRTVHQQLLCLPPRQAPSAPEVATRSNHGMPERCRVAWTASAYCAAADKCSSSTNGSSGTPVL